MAMGHKFAKTITWCYLFDLGFGNLSVCRFKSRPYLVLSSGISMVWRADSWRRRQATPHLSALQTMEMRLDGANTADS